MAMTNPEADGTGIDGLLGAARAAPPEPSDALIARILADAAREAPRPRPRPAVVPAAAPDHPPAGRGGLLAGLAGVFSGLGGWGGAGALATATLAGLWIGASGVASGSAAIGGLLGAAASDATTIELMSDIGTLADVGLADAQGG